MSEELLEISQVDEVLVEHGDVVVSLEREPDPTEVHQTHDNYVAEVIPVDFGGGPDLADHMAETSFDGVPASNVVIYAPQKAPLVGTQVTGSRKQLYSEAGTANRTEVEFSTGSRSA